ncbi:MAG: ElyC/SanA/YdcF family protein [Firmicutes bacterium]|nr:ElyC/SanA/YdcF family protein [Bacillota bacterium]
MFRALWKLIKRIFTLCFICVVLVGMVQLSVLGVGKLHLKSDAAKLDHAECIIVLGAGLNWDGTPGAYLRERLDTALDLYWNGYADKLLLSGDNGQQYYNEVASMKNYVLEAGVPEEDVFLDHAGFSTYDSMYRAKAIFEVEKAIVVTQEFHEYRALFIGNVLGIEVEGLSAAPVQSADTRSLVIREFLAREKDFFKAILKVDPTYLGEPFPISGDGRLTWD